MAEEELDIELLTTVDAELPRAVGGVRVSVTAAALAAMDRHVAEDTSVEHGGVMVGVADLESGETKVTGAIRAVGSVSQVASLTFTHETWDHVGAVMERDHPDEKIVGWYHSHPHFGIFLSEHDLFIHHNFFAQPWQVAYVRDPLLDQRGFFCWDGDDVQPVDWTEVGDDPGVEPLCVDRAAERLRNENSGSSDPASADRRLRRVLLGTAATLVLVGLAVVVLTRNPGSVSPAIELQDEVMARGVPGQLLQIGTVRLTEGDAEDVQLLTEPASSPVGGPEVPVEAAPIGQGLWQLTADVPVGTRAGIYSTVARATMCPGGDCESAGEEPDARVPVEFVVAEQP